MRRLLHGAIALALTGALAAIAAAQAHDAADVERAFQAFWAARNPGDAAKASGAILGAGATFDDVLARLKQGRAYAAGVPTGVVRGRRGPFAYTLDIPATYTPATRYQVRIQLHGGVMREPTDRGRDVGRLRGVEQIYILPVGWNDAPWWTNSQLENLRDILDTVKRTYNVDENHVVVSGVSDGGTGAYYVAMRDTTPYASFLPLNGYLPVLRNATLQVDGDLFPGNLRNKPLYVVNGGKDPLYPASAVEPYVKYLASGGVDVTYRPQAEAGHDTSWWPVVKDEYEEFVARHTRIPYPARLTWETSDVQHSGRAHWLVIDALGDRPGDPPRPADPLFKQRGRSGLVNVVANGNRIAGNSRGVKALTLLLSPEQFDFSRPLTVTFNDRVVFDGIVKPDTATLLKWAARDNDRTMLYGAELRITP